MTKSLSGQNKTLFIFTGNFPYQPGEEFLKHELASLSPSFDQVLIVPANRTNTKIEIDYPNVKLNDYIIDHYRKTNLLRINKYTKRFIKAFKPNIKYLKFLLRYLAMTNTMQSFLDKASQTIDLSNSVMYTYWFDDATTALALLKNSFKYRLVTKAHRWDLYESEYGFNKFPLRQYVLGALDLYMPATKSAFDHIINRYAFSPSKAIINRYGVQVQKIVSSQVLYDFHLVSCSLLKPVKRVDLIVKSLALLDVNLRIHWTHIGSGLLAEKIADLAAYSLTNKNITYDLKGQLSNEDVIDFYRKTHCDLFINVSASEGTPVSIMEANSFGIPAMATDVGGTKELVNNESGYLITSNPTPYELSIFLKNVISDMTTLKEKSSRVRLLIESRFNATKNGSQLSTLLLNLL